MKFKVLRKYFLLFQNYYSRRIKYVTQIFYHFNFFLWPIHSNVPIACIYRKDVADVIFVDLIDPNHRAYSMVAIGKNQYY